MTRKFPSELPANTSHVVIVHAGSYEDFIDKLKARHPNLKMRFIKRVAIHYYIIQLEDEGYTDVKKSEIYKLPVLAMREEFSNYVFVQSEKSFRTMVKRMAQDDLYLFFQHLFTPFEKTHFFNFKDAKELKIIDGTCEKLMYGERIQQPEVLKDIFEAVDVVLDEKPIDYKDTAKECGWVVGVIGRDA